MRSPEYQLEITRENVSSWMKKVEKSIRDLREDEKNAVEWTYLHLVNLQDDIAYLDKFIEHFHIIRIIRDSNETAR